ncbi:hypothetical protein H5410_003243 [Solanum commersonii]|uniref:RNase H type-1 domain-containing protein n=1 Tax=Solanum commersonii TaxID=4109 RepID=A0A9J6B451_SOLCO|nr:hypothetical protein H5410_003243 [Solanum commersonii]
MWRYYLCLFSPLGEGTNKLPRCGYIWFIICIHLNYKKVILEVDSQLGRLDCEQSTAPWSISSHVQKLQHLATQFTHFKCIHTLREANFVALASKHKPSVERLRLPDQSHLMQNSNTNKTQPAPSSDSSDNSSKLQRTEVIHVTILERELDWHVKLFP